MNELNEIKTLGEVSQSLDSTARTYPVLIGENLGFRTLKMSVPLNEFILISGVGSRKNIDEIEAFQGEFHAQRNLIRDHAVGLAKYTLMGLVRSEINARKKKSQAVQSDILDILKGLGDPAYASLQPVVCNIRNCAPGGDDLQVAQIADMNAIFNITLTSKHILWVVDGQHRREGFDLVLNFLKHIKNKMTYPKKGLYEPTSYIGSYVSEEIHDFWMSVLEMAVTRCHVSIECHLGLNQEQEQQLFFDLNSKGRKVIQSLAFQYDHTDPINSFVAKELIERKILPFSPSDKDESNWHQHDGRMARKDINNTTALLCLGKTSSKTATPAIVENRLAFLTKFWETIVRIKDFGKEGAKSKTVAAQPVVLKALAKLANELAYGHQNIEDKEGYKKLIISISTGQLDFSHSNQMWRALMMSDAERLEAFPGLEKYLYIPPETNLDAGVYNEYSVRFGNRHNDIFPRLGDIIRWKVGLKPRPTVAKAIEENNA